MKRCLLVTISMLLLFVASAQSIKERLDVQVKRLVEDSQMKHGILGFYVADANTGEPLFEWNGSFGLAPASTQKIVTSVAAFELLGKDYKYKTEVSYITNGDIIIKGSGDPTFGSSRYQSTKAEVILQKIKTQLQSADKRLSGRVSLEESGFSFQPIPGGWIWDDIGNYYGAGSWGLNWRENQYDLLLKPGNKEGDSVTILGTQPKIENFSLSNLLRTGKKGSGDNAYIYFPPYSESGFVEGTFEGGSKISGSMPDPPLQFKEELLKVLGLNNIKTNDSKKSNRHQGIVLFAHHSPSIDSIIYWFMRRSINLYGEALVKTIGMKRSKAGSTDTGIAVIKRFYNDKQIVTPAELKIIDGSGLSPSNRITAATLGKILVYARKQSWFSSFEQSFPEFNGMKLKSGTIRGAKAFAGYHRSKDGRDYTVVIIVNNYDGSAGSIVNKMFKVLDVLK